MFQFVLHYVESPFDITVFSVISCTPSGGGDGGTSSSYTYSNPRMSLKSELFLVRVGDNI